MHKIQQKILSELIQNSRFPLTELAKRIKVSREVTTYHFNKLVREKIIRGFVTEIDEKALGITGAAVFINIKAADHKQFEHYLKSCHHVSWVAELTGLWNFGFSIYGTDNTDLDSKMNKILNKFGESIIDHEFMLHKTTSFYLEKMLNLPKMDLMLAKTSETDLDALDRKILGQLSANSRIGILQIAKELECSAPSISRRLARMEKEQVIQKYSIFIDYRKLGLYQYSIFMDSGFLEKENLLEALKSHTNVSFVAEYSGEKFIEFGLFVSDPYQLREKLQQIEQQFPSCRVKEISMFQKEFVSIGLPEGVFK